MKTTLEIATIINELDKMIRMNYVRFIFGLSKGQPVTHYRQGGIPLYITVVRTIDPSDYLSLERYLAGTQFGTSPDSYLVKTSSVMSWYGLEAEESIALLRDQAGEILEHLAVINPDIPTRFY